MSENKPWSRGGIERVAVLQFPGIDNAYLCLSGHMEQPKRRYGEKWHEGHEEKKEEVYYEPKVAKASITFTYDAGDVMAEWDGAYGPIQLWWKCDETWVGDGEFPEKAKPHWFYPFAHGAGHWSQMAVDDAGLVNAFTRGDYAMIFRVLKDWAESRSRTALSRIEEAASTSARTAAPAGGKP